MSHAADITRRAKSNLAFALRILPVGLRDDMEVFYAFCRTMDDLADEVALPVATRDASLTAWKIGLINGFAHPDALQRQVIEMRDRRDIAVDLMTAIIDGCQMDLSPQRFFGWQNLSDYIWKVACAVGLVSVKLFGCTEPVSQRYAVALGHALQLTNILRDVGEDLDRDQRIYLPIEEMARFEYGEHDLLARVDDRRFQALMAFEATRAEAFFDEADGLVAAADRKALTPALIMADIYRHLLAEMRRDGFRVLTKRYQVSRPRKLAILSKHLIAGRL